MNTIDLTLSREQLETVSEISLQEWMDRYNALCKEYGSCFGPRRGEDLTYCVGVRWFDTVEKTIAHFDLSSCCTTDCYGEDAWMDEDILKLIEGKTITIKDGGFDMEVSERVYGLEFTTVDGEVIRSYTKRIPLYRSRINYELGKANNRQLDIHFLEFVNNPRRLAINTERFSSHYWTSDFCPNRPANSQFCLQRVISLLSCEIETLLNSDEIPDICRNCCWTSCPVYKKFNQQ